MTPRIFKIYCGECHKTTEAMALPQNKIICAQCGSIDSEKTVTCEVLEPERFAMYLEKPPSELV